ncbi:MAG TPA: DnaA N-terminal domain-containing protein, partial [Herpetosiphonaceae bacterium]
DPNETFEQLGARRQHALDQGRQAVRERRISGDLYLFYEYLIERVGANKYTWIGEDTLAEVFSVDASTIKRWIAKLVHAGLIRRQRQFGTTSRTYIAAYDPATVHLDSAIEDTVEVDAADPVINVTPVKAEPEPVPQDQGSHADAVSFRRNDAPTFGADLRRDLKDSHLNLGGGGKRTFSQNQGLAPEIRQLLEREGVSRFYLAPQLQQQPIEELRAVSRYLDQQHNVRDRARLFAALAVGGFGALLLAGRAPQRPAHGKHGSGRAPQAQGARVDDHLKYVSGALAPYIQGGSTQLEAAAVPVDPGPQAVQAAPPSSTKQTWQQVLDLMRPTLTEGEFHTWFADARLLQVEDGQAVISTPHIFAREKLTDCYQTQLIEALRRSLGQSVGVTIVIGG